MSTDDTVPFTPVLRPLQMQQSPDDDETDTLGDEVTSSAPDSQENEVSLDLNPPSPPLCSVLNTIVDYCMMPPNELFEPDECRLQPPRQVPVLRFFGPMIRRFYPNATSETNHTPTTGTESWPDPRPHTPWVPQSSCLYVHGAFPYLLARPVAAGPDGSSHLECPWDSVASVQRMLPVLTEALETVLHETNSAFATTGTAANGVAAAAALPVRVLRRITVVTGRGFYTYCPGPAAPFLRVEYYCPADRWKVKRCLEHGLVDLPPVYHPLAPTQLPDDSEHKEPDDVLRFNCYEAHIPYTMQVFKDWNLAGLSYIHVAASTRAKFRHPLPTSIRSFLVRSKEAATATDKAVWMQSAFVAANTPEHVTWGVDPDETAATPTCLKKVTSCDIELDICVSSILNVLDVMTELPDEWEERQQIHWRAVPSLREIWSQERRRMAKLLPPHDDFLSGMERTLDDEAKPQAPPFTLNVKRDAPLSGARLAVDGMHRLLNVTEGLEDNFRRVMRDIVDRHTQHISQADAMLRTKRQPAFDSPALSDSRVEASDMLTPSHDEALEALGALHALYETPSPRLDVENPNVRSNGEPSLSSSSQTPSERLKLTLSQACASSVEETPGSLQAEFRLSQSVERGDGLVDTHFHGMDDVIDPETLAPYETFGDEDDSDQSEGDEDDALGEQRVERMLSTLATQDYMPNPHTNDPGHDDSSVESWALLSGKSKTRDLLCELEDDASVDTDNPSDRFGETSIVSNKPLASVHVQKECQFVAWSHAPNVSIECNASPPRRGDVAKRDDGQVDLLSKQSNSLVPVWTSFMAGYESERRKSPKECWLPRVGSHGVDICPVSAAPLRKAVQKWSEKTLKRRQLLEAQSSAAKRSRLDEVNESSREHVQDVGMDKHANQRKDEVEAAVWQLSQESTHSLSQDIDEAKRKPKTPHAASTTPISPEPKHQSFSDSIDGTCTTPFEAQTQQRSSTGIGNQGGRLMVEGGGDLKAAMKQTQTNGVGFGCHSIDSFPLSVSMMAIEVYVRCRTGRAGLNDSRTIALTPVSDRDKICSVVFVLCRDPGGGEPFEYLERGCLFTPITRELESASLETTKALRNFASDVRKSLPSSTFGVSAPLSVECVRDERQLLLRLASIVRWKDPDMLLSWDTQGAGLGYILERGLALGKEACGDGCVSQELDMARLLGRTPTMSSGANRNGQQLESDDACSAALADMTRSTSGTKNGTAAPTHLWKGSGLGTEWDERVGAGAAAASINGRLVFAAWKIVAEEVKHPNYSYLPAIVSLVLSKRIPFHDNLKLGQWYGYERGRERWRVLHHKLSHAVACLQLFDALDVVGRSGEAARLSGVEFSQSFPGIRGSQYKVEGVLLRALKSLNSEERGSKKGRRRPISTQVGGESLSTESASQTQSPWKARRGGPVTSRPPEESASQSIHQLSDRCYYFFSPSLQDTTRQEALEVQALTLEPQSGHQSDPVVVCDFTALYPSLVIAYNLCFSTCAGKLDYHATRAEMRIQGKTTGQVGPMRYAERITAGVLKYHIKSLYDEADRSKDRAYVAPTGAVYVSETVVKGVLPQVLDEMLSTRAMLKKAAKQYKKLVPNLQKSVLRQLEARQLALKYVANVTYGYTSATFSGRCAMPLLADSIVECGRRTLSNAIKLVGEWGNDPSGRWQGVEVLYGDTDSIFVRLPGRSVAEAFEFGEDFCRTVTDSNPPPVQLKLEKVYLGSMMQTKKKYCGLKFESKDQLRPEFEAKGIETIRRDQCALTQKIVQNSLVTLYRNGLDAVKSYLFRQWALILSGSLPVSDFILTGRVRSRYRGGRIGPVQAVLARRLAEADPAKVVRHKERQSFVIVATPGVAFKLKDCVLTPMELLEQWDAYSIHFAYYITKHVNAALQRCLGLAPYFVDVSAWFDSSPKPRGRIHFWPSTRSRHSTIMISSFFGSDKCSLCGRKCLAKSRSRAAVCSYCRNDPVKATTSAMKRLGLSQNEAHASAVTCGKCNQCFEDAHTFATVRNVGSTSASSSILVTPLGNCTCIDCPLTFRRHRARENELESIAICESLDLL